MSLSAQAQLVQSYLLELHQKIQTMLENEEKQKTFHQDHWQSAWGEGITGNLENGQIIEKAGVNFSQVNGTQLPAAASQHHPELANQPFTVVGVSTIVHPINPYAPTSHFNLRYFETKTKDEKLLWWFGGGFDLTPYYGFEKDCIEWHQHAKSACDEFGKDLYPRFKQAADEYFYLKHRKEHRGIGGLFFDDFNELGFEKSFAFTQSVGEHYIKAYQAILNRRKNISYGKHERNFQLYRRGRYVEFNLLYDRGTRFGLEFGGRIESILISLPPEVRWDYNWQPPKDTDEEKLTSYFLIPKDWA